MKYITRSLFEFMYFCNKHTRATEKQVPEEWHWYKQDAYLQLR